MKLWFGYGSEHSANLVIIGSFDDAATAEKAEELILEATEIAAAEESAGRLVPGGIQDRFSSQVLDFLARADLSALGYGDPEQLLYGHEVRREGDRLVITTEESDVNALVKILVHKGAKVEVYSAHDHGGPYGRRTKDA